MHRFNIRMGKELFEWCKYRAEDLGIPASNYMIMVLTEHRRSAEAVEIARNTIFIEMAKAKITTAAQEQA